GPADSTVLPLRAAGPPDEQGNQPHHYWPFATSDLYNWRTQHANFSDNPRDVINLLETVLFTHQPTWDDCQQLLQILFTTEECERIQNEARKLVPGDNDQPTTNIDTINTSFPLSWPNWDFNRAEGKERLQVYRQALLGGLEEAACKPTNLAKVGDIQQGPNESPAAFLERIQEAFCSLDRLLSPTALKVDGVATWVHYTHVRPADPSAVSEDFIPTWQVPRNEDNPLELKFKRT
ncbi:Gag polyprotein, partial [Heterocephalus glaber]